MNFKDKLQNEIKKYIKIRNEIRDCGSDLSEVDIAILSSRLMGDLSIQMDDDFLRVKRKDDYLPYLSGHLFTIRELTGLRTERIRIKMTRKGYRGVIELFGNQAYLFLAMLVLKFRDAERDATHGFSPLDDIGNTLIDIDPELFKDENPWDPRTLENLRNKLQRYGVREIVQSIGSNERAYRIAVSPLRINFSDEAKSVFEQVSGHAYSHFCKLYNVAPDHLRGILGDNE